MWHFFQECHLPEVGVNVMVAGPVVLTGSMDALWISVWISAGVEGILLGREKKS